MRTLAKYRFRITVQTPAKTTADTGQKKPAWVPFITRYAQILPKAAAEAFRNSQLRAETTHVVVVPSDSQTRQIKPKDRILWGTRKLQILSNTNRDGMEIEREIEAKERIR